METWTIPFFNLRGHAVRMWRGRLYRYCFAVDEI
jgi:hypothetical protein